MARSATGTGKNSRTRILDAAADLVATSGVDALTFDGLAEATAISKGGILYHFGTKRELLESLVQEGVDRFEALWDDHLERDDPTPGRQARTYLSATLTITGATFNFAFLAAAAADPTVMKPLVDAYVRWQRRLTSDGVDEAVATTLRLVADGLWAADMFRLPPLADSVADGITQLLADLTRSPRPR